MYLLDVAGNFTTFDFLSAFGTFWDFPKAAACAIQSGGIYRSLFARPRRMHGKIARDAEMFGNVCFDLGHFAFRIEFSNLAALWFSVKMGMQIFFIDPIGRPQAD